jgi:hypothetical protein
MNAHDFLIEKNCTDLWFHYHSVGIYMYDFHEKYCLNGENCQLL